MVKEKPWNCWQPHLFWSRLQSRSFAKAQDIFKCEGCFEKQRHMLPYSVYKSAHQRKENLQLCGRGYWGPTTERNGGGEPPNSAWIFPIGKTPIYRNCVLAMRWKTQSWRDKQASQREAGGVSTQFQWDAPKGECLSEIHYVHTAGLNAQFRFTAQIRFFCLDQDSVFNSVLFI